jgi:hypothetical protein
VTSVRRLLPLLALLVSCRDARGSDLDLLAAMENDPSVPDVLVGAGDIGSCRHAGDEATAALLDSIPGIVFTLGDNAYPDGALSSFARCYAPTWGRHRARTRPALGNHEYDTHAASGHFTYFGALAGEPGDGYYSYERGPWHVVVLNSNIDMSEGSPQMAWLRKDLATSRARCMLAYWHHPRFSSGDHHGDNASLTPAWTALYAAGAELVMSGHEHLYERFAPQRPDGTSDSARGMRQFIVGTGGGGDRYPFRRAPAPNSEVREHRAIGVLKLTLHPDRYTWEFVPAAGTTFTDSGSSPCH